jgi:hypothetical protein
MLAAVAESNVLQNVPSESAEVNAARLWIVLVLGAAACGLGAVGPGMSDPEFFARLDYRVPYLSRVKTAVAAGDFAAAKTQLLAVMRTRRTPVYCVNWEEWDRPARTLNWWQKPERPDPTYGATLADKVCRHIFTGEAVARYPDYPMGPDINWAADPYHYREWTVQLNRHTSWLYLGEAYWATGDEKYARAFNEQVQDWILKMPVATDGTHNRSAAWRTIEAGIRMFESWPACYQYFIQSPSFTPEAHCLMMKSFAEHARHLMEHPTSGNNWLLMESYGLACVGTMYPEFTAASEWRRTGMERLARELESQVYPDGFQKELSTSYHMVAVTCFGGALELQQLNHLSVPKHYRRNMQRMYEAILRLIKPSGFLPPTNDSYVPVEGISPSSKSLELQYLALGAKVFDRADMDYVASRGRSGKPPAELSYAFPYAGFCVMRSGWDNDARYLMFDAGPFGIAHQHEDKLHVDVYAYGKTLLYDTGLYEYDGSPYQRYVRSTAGHNTALVDGMGQNRRGSRVPYATPVQLKNPWMTKRGFDYASGTYNEGYGPNNDKTVTHHRQVLFVKPDYWVVLDDFQGTGTHQVDFHWHLRPGPYRLDDTTLACATTKSGEANLLLSPASSASLSARVAVGETSPIGGWITSVPGIDDVNNRGCKVAAPEVVYTWNGPTPLTLGWLLYPSKGTLEINPRLESLPLADAGPGQALFKISLPDGTADYALLAKGLPGRKRIAGLKLDGEIAVVHTDESGRVVETRGDGHK